MKDLRDNESLMSYVVKVARVASSSSMGSRNTTIGPASGNGRTSEMLFFIAFLFCFVVAAWAFGREL